MSRRALWLWTAGAGLVVPAIMVAIGYRLPNAAIAGLVLVITVIAALHVGLGERVELPRLPYDKNDGARLEVSSISWSLYGREGMTAEGERHLRRLALLALGDAGIDPREPAGRERATAELGADAVQFLVEPGRTTLDARRVRSIITSLETLEARP